MSADKLPTVDELARANGQFRPAKKGCKWQQDTYSPEHAAASVRHGWHSHKYHANEPMRLRQTDYLAALEAVQCVPIEVHPGALSEHCPHNDKAAQAAKGAI